MFDLENSIADWRRQMLAAGIKTPVPLEELEIHLREEIERQMESGLNGLEAFSCAVQKIGEAHLIQNEFKKAEETKEESRYSYKPKQIWLAGVAIIFPLLTGVIAFANSQFNWRLAVDHQLTLLVASVACPLLAWSGRLGYRIFPAIGAGRIKIVVYAGLVALLFWYLAFCYIVFSRHDSTINQAVAWGLSIPAGAFIDLLWGLDTAARKKIAAAGS